jgi:hypothetical protein
MFRVAGRNMSIEVVGWAALGNALQLLQNLKKLGLGEFIY